LTGVIIPLRNKMMDCAFSAETERRKGSMIYPWQWPTALAGLDVVQKLRGGYDAATMAAEVAAAGEAVLASPQAGPYHNGKWMRLGLVGPSGDYDRSYFGKGEKPAKTEVLKAMPTVEAMLDSLPGEVASAIVSKMEPGAYLRWHRDSQHSVDLGEIRLHLPVVTSPDAVIEIGHHKFMMTPGDLWYGDFSFPHRVWNRGTAPRIHLMVGLRADDRSRTLFSEAYLAAAPRRRWARAIAGRVFDFSERLHAEGRYASQYRAERKAVQASGGAFRPDHVGMRTRRSAD
jgi:hypothetical protein